MDKHRGHVFKYVDIPQTHIFRSDKKYLHSIQSSAERTNIVRWGWIRFGWCVSKDIKHKECFVYTWSDQEEDDVLKAPNSVNHLTPVGVLLVAVRLVKEAVLPHGACADSDSMVSANERWMSSGWREKGMDREIVRKGWTVVSSDRWGTDQSEEKERQKERAVRQATVRAARVTEIWPDDD